MKWLLYYKIFIKKVKFTSEYKLSIVEEMMDVSTLQ